MTRERSRSWSDFLLAGDEPVSEHREEASLNAEVQNVFLIARALPMHNYGGALFPGGNFAF
jgi:hypothetical protein